MTLSPFRLQSAVGSARRLRFLRKPRVYGIYFACILAHISVSVCSNLRFEQRLSGAVFGTALLRLRVFFFFGAKIGTVIRTYRAHQEHRLHFLPSVLLSARVYPLYHFHYHLIQQRIYF